VGRLDEAWRIRIVAQRLADFADANLEHSIAHRDLRPAGVEQFIFGRQLPAPLQQVSENRERLRPDSYCFAASTDTSAEPVKTKGRKVDLTI
jgi:hypothetical protein